ncbi:hypothetical protein D9757_005598 [Collybiopsis confluens]|uniref:PinX1-related protein 1 n=1 Tax=Collybiopsis confluens TaxID=2823264 RepID=A0A8H5HST4_9AGAR|nr:hypothetical protein D9757_005598 [Collybiopsis confluens]
MGLAGRKVKQRIGPDPRNLGWADDASKFGASYLAKFGWDSSKGLGLEGEGRTSHIKVSQKLDMLGIGAAQSKDPNGIAWKQNKDFESLLKRLNENAPASVPIDEATSEHSAAENAHSDTQHTKNTKEERKRRKREEKEQMHEKKKRKRDETRNEEETEQKVKRVKSEEKTEKIKVHRARAIAAKDISSKSALSIAEVLGIASSLPSSSTSTAAAPTPSGSLTPLDQDLGLEKITTSAKSVSDYFKERLLAKGSGKSPLPADADRQTLGLDDIDDDVSHAGLGSVRTTLASANSAYSPISLGMSKFASLFTAAGAPTDSQSVNKTRNMADANDEKAAKKLAKEERRRREGKEKKREKRKD